MIKNIAIVSLSRGILGEPFMQFELEIGLRRMGELGLNVKFMPHALKICCRHFAIRTLT